MTKKFGVSLPDELAEKVEEPLEYGDSRSQRFKHLVQTGLLVEDFISESTGLRPTPQQQREVAEEALELWSRENGIG